MSDWRYPHVVSHATHQSSLRPGVGSAELQTSHVGPDSSSGGREGESEVRRGRGDGEEKMRAGM